MRTTDAYRGRTILIVEDHADTREIYRRLLEARGARVLDAEDGPEALFHIEQEPPDVIFCDLATLFMNGIEFARRIRAIPRCRGVLLIAMTGRKRQADLSDTWSAGFDGHFVKPLTDAALDNFARRLGRHIRPGAEGGA
jgi:CheY-like chemotaxis protein